MKPAQPVTTLGSCGGLLGDAARERGHRPAAGARVVGSSASSSSTAATLGGVHHGVVQHHPERRGLARARGEELAELGGACRGARPA